MTQPQKLGFITKFRIDDGNEALHPMVVETNHLVGGHGYSWGMQARDALDMMEEAFEFQEMPFDKVCWCLF